MGVGMGMGMVVVVVVVVVVAVRLVGHLARAPYLERGAGGMRVWAGVDWRACVCGCVCECVCVCGSRFALPPVTELTTLTSSESAPKKCCLRTNPRSMHSKASR